MNTVYSLNICLNNNCLHTSGNFSWKEGAVFFLFLLFIYKSVTLVPSSIFVSISIDFFLLVLLIELTFCRFLELETVKIAAMNCKIFNLLDARNRLNRLKLLLIVQKIRKFVQNIFFIKIIHCCSRIVHLIRKTNFLLLQYRIVFAS